MALAVEKFELADNFSVYANPAAKFEVEFIYKEIFEDKCYDVAEFPDDAFMVDAGGNIGMFSLYMKKKYPSSTILAFEPAPDTFNTFKRNMELHNISGVQAHQCGLGRESASQTLTFYPKMPGNSTLYGDDKNQQLSNADQSNFIVQLMSESQTVQVDVKRLSTILNEVPDLKRIHLLKIDVEGAELDVLYGLDDRHWDLIDNVVLEICNSKGEVATTEALLQSKGFQTTTEEASWAPKHLEMYMMTARRE